ncbi:MAG TPA: glycoside hydrolase family 2 TIM barrel-domain containing protein [Candidatus Omnitrophota bacterium]|nr:glycoside hydrolase family 2 TIM barrel-domain containing protein [Candidatus Omnitrophota bacterium]
MSYRKAALLIFVFVFCQLAQVLLPARQAAVCLYAQESVLTPAELIEKAWAAHGKRDTDETFRLTGECIARYAAQAQIQQASLQAMPKTADEINAVGILNSVAVAFFIQGESYMRQGKFEEAKQAFQTVIDKYGYAQSWDQRGWFWSVAEVSRQSLQKMVGGSIDVEQKREVSQLPTKIVLYDPGKEDFVNYAQYGEFKNAGSEGYRYIIKDQEGLSVAVGEGIYPNTTSVRWDPEFKKAQKEKRLEGSQWDFMHSPDLQAAFFKWATGSEPAGVRLFYIGLILEKAGLLTHALKAYYAVVVHYPGAYGWTYFRTPWYVGQAAISKINYVLRRNPQIGYRLEDADIRIINGFDNDVSNDIVIANPGRFVKIGLLEKLKSKPSRELLSIKRRLGKGKVRLVQYETGDWELLVNGKPFVIKGITYAPTKVGQSPDDGTMGNWMYEDCNENGKADGPYDAFVDKNRNGVQDKDEPAVGDFKLMQEMGVNVIRLYHHPNKINKELLRDLYQRYGIMVIMGDFLGKYTLGSGAKWDPGTDYTDEEHRKNMLESVKSMVNEYKDEPYILFWLLGNENVYGYACNANKEPEAFFRFASEAAREIKAIDPEHPVGLCNGDIVFLDKFGKNAPDIDIFGANAYRGNYGFGFLWRQVKEEADRPAFITEFGCSAYAKGKSDDVGEEGQADYHQGSWEDIKSNMAFESGAGNAIGGVAFEWLDEWWKGYEPFIHDKKGTWVGPFPDGYMYEEWLGLCAQGDGALSPFLRQLRKSYYTYKKLWK